MAIQAEIRVLGPVEAIGPSGPARFFGARQRGLLALLALGGGQAVPRSRLIDALWGDDPPRTAVKTLHSHVARARQALTECGLEGLLTTSGTGYALVVPRECVDAYRFEDQVEAARCRADAGAYSDAAALLQAALQLWRGDALADAAPAGWAAAEVARLHELRLSATEDLWEAELVAGRHREAALQLRRLLVDQPGRERLVGLLMLALYRCGKRTEALEAYQQLRAHLADELGLDPVPELQERYAAILREDPALRQRPTVSTDIFWGPSQLPAGVGHFTGRERHLSILDAMVDDSGREARIAVISGPAGMGKTDTEL